ncbi:c-type cytochrome [Faecalibacter sp. LW9]|uniref:c-type cytochrome n=1 Tax=Faecalibacter sp. LW9 TaxID=3103144 RepID=UPI002AFDFA18|nr:c-type cytochrome [Faecalibacter sp. LW9]
MKKIAILGAFVAVIVSCASATSAEVDQGKEIAKVESQWENLKVLPQDISEEDLKGMMREFNTALGVKCNHCHAPNAEGKMDFASDAKQEKEFARHMITMTKELNEKHFNYDASDKAKVSCFTCHQGSVKPKKIKDLELKEPSKINLPQQTQAK